MQLKHGLDTFDSPAMTYPITVRGRINHSDGYLLHILMDEAVTILPRTDAKGNADIADREPE
jgi:hypothetical protein